MKFRPLFATALLFLLLSACQQQPDMVDPGLPLTSHVPAAVTRAAAPIGTGDILDIYVMEDSSLNGQFQVRESGNIVMPRIGRIHLGGSSLTAAQDIVRNRIQTDQIKKATVIVERLRAPEQAALAEMPKMLVFISGAVARPGQHRMPLQPQGGLSAFEALMTAGGPTTYADQRRAYILRKTASEDRSRIPVNLHAVSRGEARDVQLQDGDVLVVPQRQFGL